MTRIYHSVTDVEETHSYKVWKDEESKDYKQDVEKEDIVGRIKG